MTSSPDRTSAARTPAPPDAMPPALSSMWRLCRLGYRHEPRLMLAAFVLSQLAALPDALLALWLMLLGKGVVGGDAALVRWSAVGLGVSAILMTLTSQRCCNSANQRSASPSLPGRPATARKRSTNSGLSSPAWRLG